MKGNINIGINNGDVEKVVRPKYWSEKLVLKFGIFQIQKSEVPPKRTGTCRWALTASGDCLCCSWLEVQGPRYVVH